MLGRMDTTPEVPRLVGVSAAAKPVKRKANAGSPASTSASHGRRSAGVVFRPTAAATAAAVATAAAAAAAAAASDGPPSWRSKVQLLARATGGRGRSARSGRSREARGSGSN